MFESVKYEISANYTFVEVKIWVRDGELHYSKTAMGRPDECRKDAISSISVEDFSRKIESIRIPEWKKNYEPVGFFVMDGESWDVKYKDSDYKESKASGINAYPTNWKKFLKVLSEVAGNVNID